MSDPSVPPPPPSPTPPPPTSGWPTPDAPTSGPPPDSSSVPPPPPASAPPPPPWPPVTQQPAAADVRPLSFAAIAGAVALVVGCVVPWYTINVIGASQSFNGFSRDDDANNGGVLLTLIALVCGAFAAAQLSGRRRGLAIAGLVLGLIALAIGAAKLTDVQDLPFTDVGIGLWVVVAGALALSVSFALTVFRRH